MPHMPDVCARLVATMWQLRFATRDASDIQAEIVGSEFVASASRISKLEARMRCKGHLAVDLQNNSQERVLELG